jgi:hypothetical protein
MAGDIQLKNWALMRQRYGTTRSSLLVFNALMRVFTLGRLGAHPSSAAPKRCGPGVTSPSQVVKMGEGVIIQPLAYA